MNKQEKIIVALLVIALLGWMFFAQKFAPPRTPQSASQPASGAYPQSPSSSSALTQEALAPNPSPTPPTTETPRPPEQIVHLRNDSIDVELTSYGGGVKSVTLKKYEIRNREKHPVVLKSYGNSVALALENLPDADSNAVFNVTHTSSEAVFERVTSGGLKVRKVFKLAAADEFKQASEYVIKCQLILEPQAGQTQTLSGVGVVVGSVGPLRVKDNGNYFGVDSFNGQAATYKALAELKKYSKGIITVVDANTKTLSIRSLDTDLRFRVVVKDTATILKNGVRIALSTLKEGDRVNVTTEATVESLIATNITVEGFNETVQWVAVKNQYFALVLTPWEPASIASARAKLLDVSDIPLGAVQEAVTASLVYPDIQLVPGQATIRELTLYAGPKEYKRLLALGNHQDEILQFGRLFLWRFTWVSAICKVMLLSLIWLNSLVKNWGVAIIILTAIIRGIFWPVTGYGTRQMKKMQALAPQIKVLQEKYKGDTMKMHQEIQKFYRNHKVHPMSGCLPALIQMPFMVAFWSILVTATELWGAHFLWVQDLSQPDSLFMMGSIRFDLMMLFMGATQFWQAWLTPAAEPQQRTMGLMMPLVMIVMMYMWKFSAALVLYWTVANLFTIFQTYLTRQPTGSQALAGTAVAPRKAK